MNKHLLNLERDIWLDGAFSNAEFIPMISKDDEDILLGDGNAPTDLPILPLRDNVLFPGEILPIAVSRKRSLRLVNEAKKADLIIGIVTQCTNAQDPHRKDLYDYGTTAKIIKMFDLPNNGPTMVVVQGLTKFHLDALEGPVDDQPLFGHITPIAEPLPKDTTQFTAKVKILRKMFSDVLRKQEKGNDTFVDLKGIEGERVLINFIAGHIDISTDDRQSLLDCNGYPRRLNLLLEMLSEELQFLKVKDDVQKKAQISMDRQQREYILSQQMKAIQDELGGSPIDEDVAELRNRAETKHWDDSVAQVFERELLKLQRAPMQSPDYTVQLNYLNEMLDLPWNEYTTDNLNTTRARKVLDHDHYGIEKVKDRIIEQIAVMKLKDDMKAPILCLVGPPGTGKTSLGKSIAEALGRKYVRVALGGLHDEAEIRGHRKTYVGAMTGRIIKGIKRAGSSNPVFILDEIDKIQNQTNQGDPTSALLEVLDPEQNSAFHDNYLDVDYDLSKVMFIATANTLSTIQPALLDRMEVIELSGYILEEKIEIAKRHLLPRQLKENGFSRNDVRIGKSTLTEIISSYTRESGVRQLDKVLAQLIRKIAVKFATDGDFSEYATLRQEHLRPMLGLPVHNSEIKGREPKAGVVTGLAWTSVGGEILFIESSLSKGKGTMTMTGNLGDVMKESATLAFEYLKANAERFGINQEDIDSHNLHIHVPEGATPKDGPSAGITIFVAMISIFTRKLVKTDWAMTGEITLRGAVTPVGGIREKILAAKRAGITHILLSEDNRRDIEDIPQDYLKGLSFHYITEMDQALPLVLCKG